MTIQILALPSSREALIESGALPYCAELLQLKLAEWSEESVCCGWANGIEFDVWLQINTEPPEKLSAYTTLNTEQREYFLELSKLIGGWITWTDEGFVYMPICIWDQYIRDTKSEQYQEALQQVITKQFNEKWFSGQDRNLGITEDELNTVIDEVREEIATEQANGTYVEPIEITRSREAFATYRLWREKQR